MGLIGQMVAVPRAQCGGGAAFFNVFVKVLLIRAAQSTRGSRVVKRAWCGTYQHSDGLEEEVTSRPAERAGSEPSEFRLRNHDPKYQQHSPMAPPISIVRMTTRRGVIAILLTLVMKEPGAKTKRTVGPSNYL